MLIEGDWCGISYMCVCRNSINQSFIYVS